MKQGALLLLLGAALVAANNDSDYNILEDPLGFDDQNEVVHLFNNQWPTNIAICPNGRQFVSFAAGLDPANTNDGQNNVIAVGELKDQNTEVAYPNSEINSPPGGAIDYTQSPPVARGLSEYFIGVLGLFCDSGNNLWCVDNGRAIDKNGAQALASPGGAKIIAINTETNTVFRTIVFNNVVVPPDSFLSELTVDEVNNYTYISDSSSTLRNAIVVCDLSTGECRRTLENDPSVVARYGFVPFCWGDPIYQTQFDSNGNPIRASYITYGVDGIGLTNEATTLFYSRGGGRYLFSIPTVFLRDPNATANEVAFYVRNYGEKGWGFGLTVSNLYRVFTGNAEQDAVVVYDSNEGLVTVFSHDKRINVTYSLDIFQGYLYFLVNQLNYLRGVYPGQGDLVQDRRKTPYVLFKKQLSDGESNANH